MNSNALQISDLSDRDENSILEVDAQNPFHLELLKKGYNNLLGLEASIHGAGMTGDVPTEVIKAINAKILKVKFFMVGKEIGGIATSFDTFAAKRNHKTKRVEIYRGEYLEDFTVDPFLNQIFRKMNGVGLGTAFTRARIWQSVVAGFGFAQAQVKEIAQDNEPMAGLMNKHGGIIGSAETSRVLELKSGPTPDMTRRFGANVEMLHLPGDRRGKKSDPNNFLLRWFDGEHEVVGIYTRTVSTFTGDPVVRLQLTSNGNLPNNEMLKEVLASIMTAGHDVIRDRGWGLPIGAKIPAFGGPVPVIRIHAYEEPQIVRSLVQMDAEDRLCGSKLMVAAILDNDNIPNQQAAFGQKLAKADKADGFDPAENDNEPIFGFDAITSKDDVAPFRPAMARVPNNENLTMPKAA